MQPQRCGLVTGTNRSIQMAVKSQHQAKSRTLVYPQGNSHTILDWEFLSVSGFREFICRILFSNWYHNN